MAKSNDIKQVALKHYRAGKSNRVIYEHLASTVSIETIRRWTKLFAELENDVIPTFRSPGRPRSIRTNINIKRSKRLLKTMPARAVSRQLAISRGSLHRIVKKDLHYKVNLLFFSFVCFQNKIKSILFKRRIR